jgi:hypothetical protein
VGEGDQVREYQTGVRPLEAAKDAVAKFESAGKSTKNFRSADRS